jgi:hypothetical protein
VIGFPVITSVTTPDKFVLLTVGIGVFVEGVIVAPPPPPHPVTKNNKQADNTATPRRVNLFIVNHLLLFYYFLLHWSIEGDDAGVKN